MNRIVCESRRDREAPSAGLRGVPPDAAGAAEAAAAAVRRRWDRQPRAGLILGTGLGGLAGVMAADVVIPFRDIPHFPQTTAPGHRGQVVCGRLAGTPAIALDGRCHRYEGHSRTTLMLPVFMLRALGVERLMLSNASGGLNPRFLAGDIMVVADHIDLMFGKPAGPVGSSTDDWRPGRIVAPPYDAAFIAAALAIARRENFAAYQGTYVGVTGPNYETRAEYRFLRCIGGDAVGMSTVPEAVAAARCGLPMVAISVITNVARPNRPAIVAAEEVLKLAQQAEPKVWAIARGIVGL